MFETLSSDAKIHFQKTKASLAKILAENESMIASESDPGVVAAISKSLQTQQIVTADAESLYESSVISRNLSRCGESILAILGDTKNGHLGKRTVNRDR
jgi:hypothetical protein